MISLKQTIYMQLKKVLGPIGPDLCVNKAPINPPTLKQILQLQGFLLDLIFNYFCANYFIFHSKLLMILRDIHFIVYTKKIE